MHYVIGLGNPGAQYERTRHNIGWLVVDTFAAAHDLSAAETVKPHQAVIRRGAVDGQAVWCVYPQTFMNRSGETVRSLWREDPDATVVVVHDEVALPLGELKVSYDRGHGGHNGVRSIIEQCHTTAFVRVRVGVASRALFSGATQVPTGAAMQQHVLGKFSFLERSAVAEVRETAARVVTEIVQYGHEAAMNAHN